jgi:hypothetical protein
VVRVHVSSQHLHFPRYPVVAGRGGGSGARVIGALNKEASDGCPPGLPCWSYELLTMRCWSQRRTAYSQRDRSQASFCLGQTKAEGSGGRVASYRSSLCASLGMLASNPEHDRVGRWFFHAIGGARSTSNPEPVDLEHNAHKNKHQERSSTVSSRSSCCVVRSRRSWSHAFPAFVLAEIGQFTADPIGVTALDCQRHKPFAVEFKPFSQLWRYGDRLAINRTKPL